MRSVDVSGKTVDEAVFKALNELSIGIDDAVVEVLAQGSKGIFGIGAKEARVKVSHKEPVEMPLTKPADRPSAAAQPVQRAEQRQQAQPTPTPRAETERVTSLTAPGVERPPAPRAAEQFLKGVCARMGFAVDVLVEEDEMGYRITLRSRVQGVLIGYRGETLDALQYLTNLVVNSEGKEYKRVMLDSENYREKRKQTLERLAQKLARKVAATNEQVALEPMNPFERRVLHAALQNHPSVATHSEGDEPHRFVVITPK